MSAPMTAEEIREQWHQSSYGTLAVGAVISFALDWMRARERKHAELLARVERLEAKVMGDGR